MSQRKKTTTGYIVSDDHGWPLTLGRLGVLWVERLRVSVFPSRKAAQRAIKATKVYAAHHAFTWGDRYAIRRIKQEADV